MKSAALTISYPGKIQNEQNFWGLNDVLKYISLISNHSNFYGLLRNSASGYECASLYACVHMKRREERSSKTL